MSLQQNMCNVEPYVWCINTDIMYLQLEMML